MSFVVNVFQLNQKAPQPTKRHRASKPKVKSGCWTCKKRRIKCDESRPCCQRCITFGTQCEGYEPRAKPERPSSKEPDKIRSIIPLLSLEPFEAANIFQDDEEYQYFIHFREATVFELCEHMGFSGNLWNYITMQACSAEPCLRMLLISLASLSKSATDAKREAIHQQYALKQYGKSLRGLQKRMSTRDEPHAGRIALIASLMIFCFETQFGCIDAAVSHMRTALGILNRRLATIDNPTFSHIEHDSPFPDIEYDLYAALVRADHSMVTHSPVLKLSYLPETKPIPSTFTEMQEARDFSCELIGPSVIKYLPHSVLKDISNMTVPSQGYFNTSQQYMPTPVYLKFARKLEVWKTAYAPIYAKCSSDPKHKDFLPASLLQLHTLCASLLARKLHWPNQALPETMRVQAREIISLGRQIITHERFPRNFTGFDTGVVFPFFVVIITCEDPVIRRAALDLYRIGTRRESVLNSEQCIAAGENLLKLEERSLDCAVF
ncbi:hypothetical protein B0O99DRAFT_171660 [Bisporella sp. PMI_857]|nr:hypothetical protein B0O99DRAFT_171660 [Bisporella sp. PMI_857]